VADWYATTGVTDAVITAEQARADWDSAAEDLREGDPETEFTVWVRGTHAPRVAPTRYTPLPEQPGI